jgi:predicted nucleotidyltransferase
VFRDRSDVIAVYLFGSTARGTARLESDVDVAVLFDRRPLQQWTDAPRPRG